MIPILLQGTTVRGFLPDALSCVVTEERNGTFELTMTYPVTAPMFSELSVDRFIKAKPNDTADNQLFRIYEITKPINGIVTVNAEHISYALSHFPVSSVFITGTATQAINAVLSNANSNLASTHGFSVAATDMTAVKEFSAKACSARAALGGIKGSVLDTFGGEYEFDNYVISLNSHRGSDTGVLVAYGKNLTDLKLTTSMENSYTALFPYCLKDDVLTILSERRITVTNSSGIAQRVLLKDFTSSFGNDEEITQTALRNKANAWLADNDINCPTINLTVSFIHLWQSPEYASLAALEKVSLCDYVTVRHSVLGIDVKAQVIKTVYDTLGERYTKIELGSAKANFADTIRQTTQTLRNAIDAVEGVNISAITEAYLQAIEDATNAITGNSGGFVVLNPAENPQELLVMNTADKNTATNLWRWNLGGLGYSSNGYNGTYRTAITMNGAINADFITAGTLTANIIRAGVLTSAYGDSYFNLETGLIHTANAEIVGGSIRIGGNSYYTKIAYGSLTQYLQSSGGLVGGLVPTGSGGNTAQTLYFDGSSNSIYAVDISYQMSGGGFGVVARFLKTAVELKVNTSVSGSLGVTGMLSVDDKINARNGFEMSSFGGMCILNDGTYSYPAFYGNSSSGGAVIATCDFGNSFDFQAKFTSSAAYIYKKLYASSNIETNTDRANVFAGLTHYRTTTFGSYNYTASVAFGCGIANNQPSAALEVKNGSTIVSRLDVFESAGEALICLRGNSYGSTSRLLELGSASMWWGGNFFAGGSIYSNGYLVSSTEEIKENIRDVDSAIPLFKASKIYKYNYKNLEEADAVDGSSALIKSAKAPSKSTDIANSVGFVIGRETPTEVIAQDGQHIDLYTMASVNWKATQEIIARLEALESGGTT